MSEKEIKRKENGRMSGCEKGWKVGMSGENYSKNLGSTIGDTIYNFFFIEIF